MSDQRAVDLVLRARNEVSEGADEAASSLDQLAQEAQQLDSEFKQLEEAGAAGEQFDHLREAVGNLNAEFTKTAAAQQAIDSFVRVKAEAEQARGEFVATATEVERLKTEMAQVEEPTKAMERALARAEKAAARASQQLDEKSGSLRSLSADLKVYGVDTSNLSGAQDDLMQRTQELQQELNSAKSEVGEMGREAAQAGAGFSDMQKAIGLAAGALAALGAKQQFGALRDEQEQLQRNLLRTQALIEASGREAEVSAEQMHEQARQLALATLESTEGVMEAQQILLGYQNIGTEAFDRITERAADYAAVMQTSVVGATRQLARAFDDPAGSIDALSRVFTSEQREMVRAMQETNGVAAAQEEMLRLLDDRVGGVSRAQAEGLAGAQDTLAQKIQEARIALADSLQVGQRATGVYESMAAAAESFTEALESGDYDGVVRVLEVMVAILGSATATFIGLKGAALATAAAKRLYAANTATATRNQLAFNRVLAANPIGLVATAVGLAAGALVGFSRDTDTAKRSLEGLNQPLDSVVESMQELSRIEQQKALREIAKDVEALKNEASEAAETIGEIAEQALTRIENASQRAPEQFREIFEDIQEASRQAANGIDVDWQELDERLDQAGLSGSRYAQRIREMALEQARAGREAEQLKQRHAELSRELGLATEAAENYTEATEKATDAQEELNEMLKGTNTTWEEVITGISSGERKWLDAYEKIKASGKATEAELEKFAKRAASNLRSAAATEAFEQLGPIAANAIAQANEELGKTAGNVGALNNQIRNLLSQGQQAQFDLSEAIQAAQTVEELKAAEQGLENIARANTRARIAGQRSGYEDVKTWELRNQLRERAAELENQSEQAVQRETRSLQEQRREVQGLATDINQLPERIETNIALSIETTPQQLQQQIAQLANQLNAEVPVKLVVDQSELSQLTQTIQQAARRIGASVASEIIKELRKRG